MFDKLEKEIEEKFNKGVRRLGGRSFKWVSPGVRGVPDRVVIMPGGLIWFVELKRDGGVVSPLQKNMIRLLNKLGANALVVEGEAEVAQFLRALEQEQEARGL